MQPAGERGVEREVLLAERDPPVHPLDARQRAPAVTAAGERQRLEHARPDPVARDAVHRRLAGRRAARLAEHHLAVDGEAVRLVHDGLEREPAVLGRVLPREAQLPRAGVDDRDPELDGCRRRKGEERVVPEVEVVPHELGVAEQPEARGEPLRVVRLLVRGRHDADRRGQRRARQRDRAIGGEHDRLKR